MTKTKLNDFSLYKESKKFTSLKFYLEVSFSLTALNFEDSKTFATLNDSYFSLKSDYKELFL